VTDNGDELSANEMIHRLMVRVKDLESRLSSLETNDTIIFGGQNTDTIDFLGYPAQAAYASYDSLSTDTISFNLNDGN
tara:strand:+ start:267 stop:500 length:234 start_codon:yes stop_codon:yes gene_type:complete